VKEFLEGKWSGSRCGYSHYMVTFNLGMGLILLPCPWLNGLDCTRDLCRSTLGWFS
jgi:hypothetical protein